MFFGVHPFRRIQFLFVLCVMHSSAVDSAPYRRGFADFSYWAMWIMCLALGHNLLLQVRLEPETLWSKVCDSTYWSNTPPPNICFKSWQSIYCRAQSVELRTWYREVPGSRLVRVGDGFHMYSWSQRCSANVALKFKAEYQAYTNTMNAPERVNAKRRRKKKSIYCLYTKVMYILYVTHESCWLMSTTPGSVSYHGYTFKYWLGKHLYKWSKQFN